MDIKNLVSRQLFSSLAEELGHKEKLPVILSDERGTILYDNGIAGAADQLNIRTALAPHLTEWLVSAAENAFQWGEVYYSTSPLGLVTITVPVSSGDTLAGAITSGFIIFPQMKSDYTTDLAYNIKRMNITVAEGRLAWLNIPVLTKTRLRRYANTLLSVSARLQLNDINTLRQRHFRYRQQVNIANFLEYTKDRPHDQARTIIEKQNEILRRIRQHDYNGAREILNEFLGSIFLAGGTRSDELKMRVMELVVIISRAAIDAGVKPSQLLELNTGFFRMLQTVTEFEDLCHQVAIILEEFINVVAAARIKKTNTSVQQMLQFLRQRFTEKISALDVAEAAGLSVSRALHLFREQTGRSVSDHIKKLRIDYARYLLEKTDDSVGDIALAAGFFDQSHFTRHFKTVEKATPLAFRQTLGKQRKKTNSR